MNWLVWAEFLQSYYIIPFGMFILVTYIGYRFYLKYITPAKNLNTQLESAISALKKVEEHSGFNKNSLDSIFENGTPLKHAWLNYKNSFHDIYETVDGEDVLVSSRATVSSDVFFSQAVIVDTPLRVEFYKHLPGIITGVGIIATFAGLLFGLLAFDPAGDPAKVQDSLGLLLGGVSEAFMASALAIGTAMIITWREKSWLRQCYEQLETLTTEIDKLFETDSTGEEYLAKLLKSSQANETNARQLKDSLVNDLKVMMTNLVEENKKNQIAFAAQLSESYAKSSQDMATQIGQSITDTLQAPLDKIASSVQQVSGNQGSAVQELMTDVLTAFMSKLESTFGSQMTGMNEMMTQSVSAMKEMQLGFSQLLTEMKINSETSTKTLEMQMSKMIEDIQQKQNAMSDQMNLMVDHLSQGAAKIGEQGQHAIEQLNGKVSELIGNLGGTMSELMSDVTKQRMEQDRVILENQQKLHEQSSALIDNLGTEIKDLIAHSQNAVQVYKENIQKLSQVTTDSITGMNNGAEKMRLASEQFNTAGSSLITVTDKTSQLIAEVSTTSTHLTSASSNLISLLKDYKDSQESVKQAISTLDGLIKQAQAEVGMSSEMLKDMNQMTTALNQVKKEMQDYLEQVSDVLVKSFESFGSSVETSLNHSLGAFDNTLDQAVKRLATGVEGLGSFVEDLEDLVQQKKN
ncbi:anti-phage defense ZorAB system ZorA [Acinetobacter haemolyticus]|uniref:anti-phage ZorAB system protein ZorA n=1 Tax=Acinetobacter haemolyticus TaxID=29430 RepID=UPI000E583B61|nr:anti-phage ZorAB system protein ZorA [Acinetobacter haemolyticus]NAR79841.1 anti-phage defense ZorAB system ZorA [Acinetobacter haemolyticus]NAR90046.1 anti-phage defense ZorAB system ZorA [Acinetobacter haemolyticus]NAR94891.1 anti-phage defense ZorAB system ZorA [Acinetobacter haemolyticus]QDJ93711.1 methyl-accepting chemotaxis protein [Acinetobacter haemolyticus]